MLDLEKLYGMTFAEGESYVAPMKLKDFPIVRDPSNQRQFYEHSQKVAEFLKEHPDTVGVRLENDKIINVFGRFDVIEQAIV